MGYVFVLDRDGNPLMPTTRCGKVRRMLKNGQAEVVSRIPFTIRLCYEPASKETRGWYTAATRGVPISGAPLSGKTATASTWTNVPQGTGKSHS